jgi:hypothetical protein
VIKKYGRDGLLLILFLHGFLQIFRQYIPLSRSVKQGDDNVGTK